VGCLYQSRPLTEYVAQRKETATKGLVASHVKSEDATDESHLSYKSLWVTMWAHFSLVKLVYTITDFGEVAGLVVVPSVYNTMRHLPW
jgi:hypothetical protein